MNDARQGRARIAGILFEPRDRKLDDCRRTRVASSNVVTVRSLQMVQRAFVVTLDVQDYPLSVPGLSDTRFVAIHSEKLLGAGILSHRDRMSAQFERDVGASQGTPGKNGRRRMLLLVDPVQYPAGSVGNGRDRRV
jgi:hypothetical protein